jgi:hypothetical protein
VRNGGEGRVAERNGLFFVPAALAGRDLQLGEANAKKGSANWFYGDMEMEF